MATAWNQRRPLLAIVAVLALLAYPGYETSPRPCSTYLGGQARRAAPCHRTRAVPVLDWPRFQGSPGQLLESLMEHGMVYMSPAWTASACPQLPQPGFDSWQDLLVESRERRLSFVSRPCVRSRLLQLSGREDLGRTMLGREKRYAPDCRMTFGLNDRAIRSDEIDWEELKWIVDDYRSLKNAIVSLIEHELAPWCAGETSEHADDLAAKVACRNESWRSSNLRHCLYPSGGSCADHTDYGLVTLQLSSGPGLEAWIEDGWQPVAPPEGCSVLYAGDMLERLSNGRIRALRHRVVLRGSFQDADKASVRQSHILFLQPDKHSVIAPLRQFRSSDVAKNMEAVRYGEWHGRKSRLAFGLAPEPRTELTQSRPRPLRKNDQIL